MTLTLVNLTHAEFEARFTFLPNHLNKHAWWYYVDGQGCLFEAYGDEVEWVLKQDRRTIWTVIDTGEGPFSVYSGLFMTNVGYLVCTEPVPEHIRYQVRRRRESME